MPLGASTSTGCTAGIQIPSENDAAVAMIFDSLCRQRHDPGRQIADLKVDRLTGGDQDLPGHGRGGGPHSQNGPVASRPPLEQQPSPPEPRDPALILQSMFDGGWKPPQKENNNMFITRGDRSPRVEWRHLLTYPGENLTYDGGPPHGIDGVYCNETAIAVDTQISEEVATGICLALGGFYQVRLLAGDTLIELMEIEPPPPHTSHDVAAESVG